MRTWTISRSLNWTTMSMTRERDFVLLPSQWKIAMTNSLNLRRCTIFSTSSEMP
ncbi:hypothetical protein FOQG_13085 [Fusarium oxysporum f. sp. raphani 54005]|uniref:Uncharacterized protein n=1 Tax=Fusarium oxysporum f. sp. raphani 54005 TaxID=1089458 RepID=X0BU97_FUSOX|nr:hypothetical protein FOQG_13085 [Fusarium oxysporum f. sp. raphani 54005]